MSEQKLTELLRSAAEPVPAPRLAGAAWHQGRRRRNRARLVSAVSVVAVTAAVAVVAGLVVAARPDGGPPAAPPGPTSGVLPSADPEPVLPDDQPVLATPAPVDVLSEAPPWTDDAPLPRTLSTDGAVPLSQDPVDRAVALYQPYRYEPMELTPVHVLGSDGRVRVIDGLDLQFPHDEGGNQSFPLRTTSLSHRGTLAAFPQPHGVVVVDLTTGRVFRHDLPGLQEHVLWLPAGDRAELLVGTEYRTVLLSLSEDLTEVRTTEEVPVSPWDLAAISGFDVTLAELPNTPGRTLAVTWRGLPPIPESGLAIKMNADLRVIEWDQRGWRRGHLIARNGYLLTPQSQGEQGLAVIDHATGEMKRTLRFDGTRQKSCCQPQGWLDDDTILLTTDVEGTLAWNVRSGELRRVLEPFEGAIAIADLRP